METGISGQRTCLVTGAAGFIGSHACRRLLDDGYQVVGVDNLNDYYSVELKRARLAELHGHPGFSFVEGDITDVLAVERWFADFEPQVVLHLAAQAGVRHSLENPRVYVETNILGFFNILDACRRHGVEHLVYASSSSVYGANIKVPFEETDRVDDQVSLYGATKRADELIAQTYSDNHGVRATGLRFFTVYGPYGRPDMAYFGFADSYFAGRPIRVFNGGDLEHDLYRDFTYIDDIVEGVVRVLHNPPVGEIPHAVYNIGNSQPVMLMAFIGELESALGEALGRDVAFEKVFEPRKTGDVHATYASTQRLEEMVGFHPSTPLSEGLRRFARWYVDYHHVR